MLSYGENVSVQSASDYEENDASEEEEEDEEIHPNKRFKVSDDETSSKGKSNYKKPPTAEEIREWKQTETLFNSNFCKFQIQSLLDESKLKEKYNKKIAEWAANVWDFFTNLDEYEDVQLLEIDESEKSPEFLRSLKKYDCPISGDHDIALQFKRPKYSYNFGLHKLNAKIDAIMQIELIVGMPKTCFLEKDYQNNKYFIKRAYYIFYLYEHLRKSDLCSSITFLDDELTPCLEITPNVSAKMRIHLRVAATPSTFKLQRFLPDKNNLKQPLFPYIKDCEEHLQTCCTPYLNAVILSDLLLKSNYEAIEKTLNKFANIKEAVILLLIWLKQRDLHSGPDGFSYLILFNIVLYLIDKKKLNNLASSYQVAKQVWVFISTYNWPSQPLSFCDDIKPNVLQEFSNNFELVFIDQNGVLNLAAFLSIDVYFKVRKEAELAVKYLSDGGIDTFNALFIRKITPELQYDLILRINDPDNFQNAYGRNAALEKCKFVGRYKKLAVKTVVATLKQGLNVRINHIVPIHSKSTNSIVLGLQLNQLEAFNRVEKGPESNTYEATAFREFWEELSECRRFDTVVQEAVYFKCNTMQGRRRIVKKIIDFVLKRKLNLVDYKIFFDQFEGVIRTENIITPFQCGTNEEATSNCIQIFDELSKVVRDLSLPLEITAIQGISSVFSHTELFPPIPAFCRHFGKSTTRQGSNVILKEDIGMTPRYVAALECVLQSAINSKWPNNLEAIHHVKIAFYLKIAELLPSKLKCAINVKKDHFDVYYQGLLFKFRLFNAKEYTLMRKYTKPDGLTAFKDTEESKEYEKKLIVLPRIIGALNGVHFRFLSFGPSTTLIKRWLRSQLLDEFHISDVTIELINAYLFLQPAPYEVTTSPQVAFFRFLKFMTDFDWELNYIVVNFNNELTNEEITLWDNDFQKNRNKYPKLSILDPYDKSLLFSRECTPEVLRRISLLSNASLNFLYNNILEDAGVPKQLFIPNLEAYNVLLNLKPLLVARRQEQIAINKKIHKSRLEKYEDEESMTIPIFEFDPVERYLKELRENYDDYAIFFHDTYGGSVIGVLWRPNSLPPSAFKISQVGGKTWDGNNLIVNTNTLIEDFQLLGKGLLKSVEVI